MNPWPDFELLHVMPEVRDVHFSLPNFVLVP